MGCLPAGLQLDPQAEQDAAFTALGVPVQLCVVEEQDGGSCVTRGFGSSGEAGGRGCRKELPPSP